MITTKSPVQWIKMDNKNIQRKIEEIQQRRTIEATKRDLMGPSGKLGRILKCFGSAIITQELEDPNWYGYVDYQEHISAAQQLPEIPQDEWDTYHEGYHFDGYSRGMHLEIKYIRDDTELTVLYKGYEVYREVNGELLCYVPGEWEKMVNTLEAQTKSIIKTMKSRDKKRSDYETKTMREKIIHYLKTKWGV